MKLTTTVRQDTETEVTVVFRADGVELGSVVATIVPKGVRVEGWHGYDQRAETIVLHTYSSPPVGGKALKGPDYKTDDEGRPYDVYTGEPLEL